MAALQYSHDLDALLADIGDSTIVMLGEASHGTHEFYTWRTAISKRLIEEKGFRFIAVEGDWPDCYQINRYIKRYDGTAGDIAGTLREFDRWPTWMWANWETAALAEWLKEYNLHLSQDRMAGFYGLDVYSLWDSMKAILTYLEEKEPDLVKAVKSAFQCFEPFNEDEQKYARFTLNGHNCRDQVLALLKEMRSQVKEEKGGDNESAFSASQNALMEVPAARKGSVEEYLHSQDAGDHYLLLRKKDDPFLQSHVPHRAIGVVYDPIRERFGNYVPSLIPQRYDAIVFIDQTKALHPLAIHHDRHKLPETWPFSL